MAFCIAFELSQTFVETAVKPVRSDIIPSKIHDPGTNFHMPYWMPWMDIPELLRSDFDSLWQRYSEVADGETLAQVNDLIAEDTANRQLQTCWMGSQFVAEQCIRFPNLLVDLLEDKHDGVICRENYRQALSSFSTSDTSPDEIGLGQILRQFRNRAISRIIWRDFNRLSDTAQTIAELSALADACIETAIEFLYPLVAAQYGTPRNSEGQEQPLLVLGMGKLGANELNLSSDIDLIFTYPQSGHTEHTDKDSSKKTLSNQEFFIRLGQKLIASLDTMTADGFVFRVDMRLRPYGESGALVCNFDALEDYYQKQGRSWERYAMVKARVIGEANSYSEELTGILRAFTFRRYIDFSAIDALREMKAMINREVKRKGFHNNIKLGAGGIREIEFIVQAFQLIRGGRESDLQQRELAIILPLLAEKQLLPVEVVDSLLTAYRFLRNTEHALQGFRDQQTQLLPDTEKEQARVAFVMGFDNWPAFFAELEKHRDCIKQHFANVITDPESEQDKTAAVTEAYIDLWECETPEEQLSLFNAHFPATEDISNVESALKALHELKTSTLLASLQTESRERVNLFMPRLFQALSQQPLEAQNPAQTLLRLLPFVQAVLRRSAYLLLLLENPQALRQLILLSSASPWIAEQMTAYPVLLDELLDESTLYTLPDRDYLQDALRQEMMRIPWDDLEGHMESLRYFKQAHRLHVAACEVTGLLPLMKVSDYLTFLAEAVLDHTLAVAWHYMTQRFGFPVNKDGSVCNSRFVIVGYGKLGGLELGHNSDLDIVFIHGADNNGYTNGDKSIDNATFYMRLAQRIIHILEAQTHGGRLYEVDTRLRPSGNSGMLVATISAFEKYQQQDAWTWEHQALVRARVVCGCPELAARFDEVRAAILSQSRENDPLSQDVIEMREKMRENLGSSSKDHEFHLKQDAGGIVDIEFMVQYAVLAWANKHPPLLTYTDNIRILEQLSGCGLLTENTTQQLIEIYKMLRSAAHRRALQQQGSCVDGSLFESERQLVQKLWQQIVVAAN